MKTSTCWLGMTIFTKNITLRAFYFLDQVWFFRTFCTANKRFSQSGWWCETETHLSTTTPASTTMREKLIICVSQRLSSVVWQTRQKLNCMTYDINCILWTKIRLELAVSTWNSPPLLCKSGCSHRKHSEDKSFITRGEKWSPFFPPVLSKYFCKFIFLVFLSWICVAAGVRSFNPNVLPQNISHFCVIYLFYFQCSSLTLVPETSESFESLQYCWKVNFRLVLSSYQTALARITTVVWGCNISCPCDRLPMFSRKYTLPNLSPNERCNPALVEQ